MAILKKLTENIQEEPYNFLTIDTTLPASDRLTFGKCLFDSYVFKNTSSKPTYKNNNN